MSENGLAAILYDNDKLREKVKRLEIEAGDANIARLQIEARCKTLERQCKELEKLVEQMLLRR
jgi:tetrahydromethanopterin S-methyltransferase subunit B